jgi:hypothetical protein
MLLNNTTAKTKTKMEKDKLNGFIRMEKPYDNYFINNKGKIYSSKRDIFLEPTKKELFEQLQLYSDNTSKNFKVCDLVAKYFLPKVPNKEEVWFKDNNVYNNDSNNLFFVNEKELRNYRNIFKAKILFENYENNGFKMMEKPFNIYCINNKGEIYNLALESKLATPIYKGSYIVKLAGVDKSSKTEFVENLVAKYFLNFGDKFKVWHNDKNKLNNNVANLRLVSEKEHSALEAGIEDPESELFGFKQMEEPYEDYYINNKGDIYSNKSKMMMNKSQNREYLCIHLKNKGKNKGYRIHDLVANYFLKKENNKDEKKNIVWHINENFHDNRVENLRYIDENELITLRDKVKIKNKLEELLDNGFVQMKEPFINYCVNNKGEVFSMTSNKFVSPDIKDYGYVVRLNDINKNIKWYTLHILVAEYFLPKKEDEILFDMVWHIDGNKFNCNVSNLKWITEADSYKLRASKNSEKNLDLTKFKRMDKPYDDYYINDKGEIYSGHKKEFKASYYDKERKCNVIRLYVGKSKSYQIAIHDLMAKYFLDKIEGKNIVWHKDYDKTNNDVENLMFVSEEEYENLNLKKNKEIMLNGELKDFVEIKNHGGYYYINKEGKIYSFYINDYLKPIISDYGYYTIILQKLNGEEKTFNYSVHRLVAEHFIEKIKDKPIVNHIDGNKKNPHIQNLEWTDYFDNALHAHATELHPKKKKVNDYVYYQLDDDKNVMKTFFSISDINDELDIKYDDDLRKIMKNKDENTKLFNYYWRREKINHDKYNDEIWKFANIGRDIDKYIEVSNYGRVRNVKTEHYYVLIKKGSYYRVSIKCGDKKFSYPVHRLVALSFLENKYGSNAHVDHINKDKINNHVSNLQWLSPKEHMKKDKGIPIVEVKDNGDIIYYETITEAAEEIMCNSGQISFAIKSWQYFRNSYWYKSSDFSEEKHNEKIKELNKKNEEKQKAKEQEKKKQKNYAKENEKRKEKIKNIKKKLKENICESSSESSSEN